jgi:hypothetical protein
MNMLKDHAKYWIECDCSSHAIAVDADSFFGSIDLSFWQLGSYLYKHSWLNRVRFAWKMIIHGRVYSDMVSLNREETQKLIEALLQSLEFTSKPKIKEKNEII